MEIETVNVLGVRVSVLDQDRAREFLFDAVETDKRGYVTVTGVHGIMEAQRNPRLIEIFNRALLVTPDGLATIHQRLSGNGYVPAAAGSQNLRNAGSGVKAR